MNVNKTNLTTIRNFVLVGLGAAVAAMIWINNARLAQVPEAEVTTIQGEKLALGTLRGKVVLVNFWATNCAVCIKEMPLMADMYHKYRARGFEALFVAMPYDRPDHVVFYADRSNLPFKIALDVQGTVNRAFGGVEFTPTTFIIDKRGRIIERVVGEPDFARLHKLIERTLNEPV
jgi:peroxiredoxin